MKRASAALGLALAACGSREARPRAWFVESSAGAGVDFVQRPYDTQRFLQPELMGGGIGLLDYDGDGDLDLYLVQSGDLESSAPQPSDRLYRNRGDGTFEDVTERARIDERRYGMGCACGDFDADGDVDIYVTNVGRNTLWRNEGDGTFRDVTEEAGVGDAGWSASAAWIDYDRDGKLDLFVTHYVRWSIATNKSCKTSDGRSDYCHPLAYDAPEPDTLFHNLGGGRFEDVSESSGIRAHFGNGLGLACGDFNGDGWPDIYVANDMNANQLWLGSASGRFTDVAPLRGCALSGQGFPEAGMGCVAFDLESDGDLDLLMTHMRHQKNTLYVNDLAQGTFGFDDASAKFGLALPSLPSTGFGVGFADFDQDGALDLYVANGRVALEEPRPDPASPYAEPNLLETWRNGRFEEVLPRGGTEPSEVFASRGLALGDLDGDGDVDLVVTQLGARVSVLRNEIARPGAWIRFDVRESDGQLARGARVEVAAGGRVQYRLVDPASSYLSSNDPRVHFGLGEATRIDAVRVHWLDGTTQDFGPREAGKHYVLNRNSSR